MPIVIQKIRDIDAAGLITNRLDEQEDYDWADLLWGALSVGRRSIMDVFAFQSYSVMELVWRCAMVRANIDIYRTHRPRGACYGYTRAFESLDGSEKGAVTYFLGLILAKLAADRKLDVPWLWHLDVYGRLNNPYGPPTRAVFGGATNSRPDLVGQSRAGEWLICEAKGRSKSVTDETRRKAKNQTRTISLINGSLPRWRFASIARFSGSMLTQEWIDPEGWLPTAEALALPMDRLFESYYETTLAFLQSPADLSGTEIRYIGDTPYRVRAIPGVDVWLGMDDRFFSEWRRWRVPIDELRAYLGKGVADSSPEKIPGVTVGKDGIYVEIGNSWRSSGG